MSETRGKVGRPKGFRLPVASKNQIAISKTGQKHKQATKDKISQSLLKYFANKSIDQQELVSQVWEGNIKGDQL